MNVELRVQALMWEYERAMELMERGVVAGVVAGADVQAAIPNTSSRLTRLSNTARSFMFLNPPQSLGVIIRIKSPNVNGYFV